MIDVYCDSCGYVDGVTLAEIGDICPECGDGTLQPDFDDSADYHCDTGGA